MVENKEKEPYMEFENAKSQWTLYIENNKLNFKSTIS